VCTTPGPEHKTSGMLALLGSIQDFHRRRQERQDPSRRPATSQPTSPVTHPDCCHRYTKYLHCLQMRTPFIHINRINGVGRSKHVCLRRGRRRHCLQRNTYETKLDERLLACLSTASRYNSTDIRRHSGSEYKIKRFSHHRLRNEHAGYQYVL
jgi:hypothetical protein